MTPREEETCLGFLQRTLICYNEKMNKKKLCHRSEWI